jgi:hypothetical protein
LLSVIFLTLPREYTVCIFSWPNATALGINYVYETSSLLFARAITQNPTRPLVSVLGLLEMTLGRCIPEP